MTDGRVEYLAVTCLFPHPHNPRLTTHQEVVDQIAAQLKAHGLFDPAHALLVRPCEDGETYEIVSGYHRWLAAQQAAMETVPCWVREMSDDEAYMALLLTNTQSELHPLEEGFHALHSASACKGMNGSEYARRAGKPQQTMSERICAARVAEKITGYPVIDFMKHWQALFAIHAAPQWLWSALVTKMLTDTPPWTVEKTRSEHVKRVHKLEEPPEWVDRETVASQVVGGTFSVRDVPRFASIVAKSLAVIKRTEEDSERFATLLLSRLKKIYPSQLSEVEKICGDVEREQRTIIETRRQADLFRTRREEEIAARISARRLRISLDEWNTLEADEQDALLHLNPRDVPAAHFNQEQNANIEWAQFSWNPVTGCLHGCPYCYARDIAFQDRMAAFYPFGFAPTFRPGAVFAPRHMVVPPEAATDTRYRNVFTCSMADLFGRWVPAAWIEAVLWEIRNAPQWNFLCLTKFPKRAIEFDLPPNCWMGTTVDLQARVKAAEDAFAHITAGVRWLSIEPMLEPLRFQHLERFQWIVLGGSSESKATDGSPATPEWRPPYRWIEDLVRQADAVGCKVYMKTNLLGKRRLELPFDAPLIGEDALAPAVFSYLKASPREEDTL